MKKLFISLLFLTIIFSAFFLNSNIKAEENNNQSNLLQHDLTKDTPYFTNDASNDRKLEEELNSIRSSLVNYILGLPALVIKIESNTKYIVEGYNEIKDVDEYYTLRIKLQDIYGLNELRRIDLDYTENYYHQNGNKIETLYKKYKLENYYTKENTNIGFLTSYENNYIKDFDGKETTKTDKKDYEVIKNMPKVNNLILFQNLPFLYADYKFEKSSFYKTEDNGYAYRKKDRLFLFDDKLVLKNILKYEKIIEGLTNNDINRISSGIKVISQADVSLLIGDFEKIKDEDLIEENFVKRIGKYIYFNDEIDTEFAKIIGAIVGVYMLIALIITIIIAIVYRKRFHHHNNYYI